MREVKIARFNFYSDFLVDDDYIKVVCIDRLYDYEKTLHEADVLSFHLGLSLLEWQVLSIEDVEQKDFEGNNCVLKYYSIQIYYSEVLV